MILLAKKSQSAAVSSRLSGESGLRVISCSAMLTPADEADYWFAGICRSKSVVPIDDGNGPSHDEFFTTALGGCATLVNNSRQPIFPGAQLEWTFDYAMHQPPTSTNVNGNAFPRRVCVQPVQLGAGGSPSAKKIGRALSFAKPGDTFDLVRARAPRAHLHTHTHAASHAFGLLVAQLISAS